MVKSILIRFLKRFPDQFDEDIFWHLERLNTHTPKPFRKHRSPKLLARLVLSLYSVQSNLARDLKEFPNRRFVRTRLLSVDLNFSHRNKFVIGFVVGINFFHKYEYLDESCILAAAQKLVPSFQLMKGSIYRYRPPNSSMLMIYIELEKSDRKNLFPQEVALLKKKLNNEIAKRVERLYPSIFSVRNEEEVMRNIIALSQQVTSSNDIPQVVISFDQFVEEKLVFTVILLRVKKTEDPSIQFLIEKAHLDVDFVPDRVQIVNYLKNSLIEANVFRLHLAKEKRLSPHQFCY